jgi:hypothetical protein
VNLKIISCLLSALRVIQIGSEAAPFVDGDCEVQVVAERNAIRDSQILKPPVDVVYLNTNRDYCCLYSQLKHWYPFVKGQGFLAGNHWGYPEIVRVLDRFAAEQGLVVVSQGEQWQFREATKPIPIQFSIPACKVVGEIPGKDRDFAYIHPDFRETYVYDNEADYYRDYQRSYYGVTHKKSGWDCLRHYEILANGCIPYFTDLDECDEDTMYFLPRDLIREGMNLPGVSYLKIDHKKFDRKRYREIVEKLLEHTRKFLTCEQMATYVLEKLNYSGAGKVLYLTNSEGADYLRCLTLIGLKLVLGEKLVDAVKPPHIYKNYSGDLRQLYGKGMTYSKVVEDLAVDRENIEERIRNKEFELIIYGSIHRGFPLHQLVLENYNSEKVAYFCGEDPHRCQYSHLHNFFMREFVSYNTHDPSMVVYD